MLITVRLIKDVDLTALDAINCSCNCRYTHNCDLNHVEELVDNEHSANNDNNSITQRLAIQKNLRRGGNDDHKMYIRR